MVLHHIFILSGGRGIPILSWGRLAVDLFMLLSGFLMAHHYLLRRPSTPWEDPSTWKEFWIRRWFRISPLYYLLLIVALPMGTFLGHRRDAIAVIWPATATAAARYGDTSFTNIVLHVSYVFGLLPAYAFRTALPDWSIGLEMQFYLAFPFLMIAFSRYGNLRVGIAIIVTCLAAKYALSFLRSFPMPSLLPLKLYVFIIGMWMAFAMQRTDNRYLLVSVCICVLYIGVEQSSESVARLFLVVAIFHMVRPFASTLLDLRQGLQMSLFRFMSHPIARFMGDTSYGLYLLHLLIVIPIAGWLVSIPAFTQFSLPERVMLCTALALPPSYLGAWILYRWVEMPGIALGKKLLGRKVLLKQHAMRHPN